MLKEYFDNEISLKLNQLLESDEDKDYRTDFSGFIVVDGEESDHGFIKYYLGNDLLAIKTVYGGDQEDIDFTEFGKVFFASKLLKCLSKII